MADCMARMDFWLGAEPSTEAPAAASWVYVYDDNGDLRWARMQDDEGFTNITIAFHYDERGNLERAVMNPKADGQGQYVDYRYDADRNVLAETDDRGDGSIQARTWTEWMGDLRVGARTDHNADGQVDRWSSFWTDASAFASETFEDIVVPDGDEAERQEYDDLGRLIRTDSDRDGDGGVDRSVWRGYDAAGRIAWKDADNDADGRADTTAIWHWWCPAGRVSSAEGGRLQTLAAPSTVAVERR